MATVDKQFEAFWKALEKPDGYVRRCGLRRNGEQRDVVRRANGTVIYELWGHPIASLTEGVLTLSDEGWKTVTTKDRINGILACAPAKVRDLRVWSNNRIWYVYAGDRKFKWNNGAQIALDNPLRLLEKTNDKEIEAKANKLRDRVKAFTDRIKKRVENGTLPTGGGECWLVKGVFGESRGCDNCEYLLKPGCGGGVTLIAKALREKGYAYPGVWMAEMGEDGEPKVSIKKIQEHWKHPIGPALRDYVRKRLVKMEFERRKADN
jgi:hypothetical protein